MNPTWDATSHSTQYEPTRPDDDDATRTVEEDCWNIYNEQGNLNASKGKYNHEGKGKWTYSKGHNHNSNYNNYINNYINNYS
eukprot:3429755-Amphidinium_carterae.2